MRSQARNPLGLALVGCGGMGHRHLRGYAALDRVGLWRGDLTAVVDVSAAAAHSLADEAESLLGRRPRVVTDLAEVLSDPDVRALDVVTFPSTHHGIAVAALESGRHVLSEKPLGLTVAGCRLMIDAAQRSGTVLATAENYRRGGANRLARAVLDAGLLGRLHLMIHHLVGGDDTVMISPWRHRREHGAIGLDMGVHLTDIVEYLLGPIDLVWGRSFVAEPIRRNVVDGTCVTATGDDSLVALMTTRAGVDVELTYLPSGPGRSYWQRSVHGSNGSMEIPRDRTTDDVLVHLAGGTLSADTLREAVRPHAALDEATIALLGPHGTGEHDAVFGDIDAAYLGIEIADFVSAVLDGRSPEVDGLGGARAVAAVHAVAESQLAARPVSMTEVMDGSLAAAQRDLDELLGLVPAGSAS